MANQIQVTVLGIGSNIIKGSPITISFPTHLISVQASSSTLTGISGVNAQINYYPNPNSQSQIQKILVSETVSAIATIASTDMFAATIYLIDGNPQNTPLDMLFPAVAPSIGDAIGTVTNSYINFKGITYFASETANALVALANTGGGGGNTIYTGDGSIDASGVRLIDLNGNDLKFLGTGGGPLIQAIWGDDGVTISNASLSNAVYVSSDIDGVKLKAGTAYIQLTNTGQTIEYEADTHTFNGVINLPTQAAPASPNDGDIWREDNTNTGLKIRINGVTKTIVVS